MPKGSEFERYVSKFLTKWLTGDKKPYAFWRTPGSGSLQTIHIENQNLSGDIIGLITEAKKITDKWNIECKTGYPNTSMWQHIRDIKTFGIKLFWNQCCKDARQSEKKPILIYRKKGKQIIIGIRRIEFEIFKKYLSHLSSISLRFNNDLPEIIFFDFEHFFNSISPKNFNNENM